MRRPPKPHDQRGLNRCRRTWRGLLLAALLVVPVGEAAEPVSGAGGSSASEPGTVVRVRIDSIIHPIASDLLIGAIEEAEDVGAEALIVELATPGGLLESTRVMFTAMLGAEVPVVVYVSPSGAQAASAGFFLLMAADVAAMAPGTNTGAAHPVGGQGEDIEGAMGAKMEQDAAATIRSLATRRGRNAELAEEAVVDSRSFTSGEALEAGLIDLVVPGFEALLREIDGRSLDKGGTRHRLATADSTVVSVELSAFRRILSALAHPNLAYILLSLGFLGLYFELMNPGGILPGVVGALCLLLALPALSVLPFSYAGIALIFLAVLLFIVEIKVTSYGLLTVGGLVALALGGLMLFDSPLPALQVSFELIGGVVLFAAVVVAVLVRLAWRAQHGKVRTGNEGLVGEVGRATTELGPAGMARPGKVHVHGELWNALAPSVVAPETPVEVVAVRGLLLEVRPVATAQPAAELGASSRDPAGEERDEPDGHRES